MGHEDWKEMLAAYALDALEPAEARALEEHLGGCAGCRAELARLRATSSLLAWDADPVTPPASLRERILASLPARPTPIRRTTPRPLVVGGAMAAAAAIAALVVSQVLLSGRLTETAAELERTRAELAARRAEVVRAREEAERRETELARAREAAEFLASPRVSSVALAGTDEAPGARAKIAIDPGSGRALLFVENLPVAPEGKAYQLWFIRNGKPLPGGVFTTDASGRAIHREEIPPQGRAATTFAVTVEPAAGVPAPTGEMVLLGTRS